jgi:lipopolysaccharide transport system ATP-binding protein
MDSIVRFENVSKQYNLGVTRTSLLKLLSNSVKRTLSRDGQAPADQRSIWALQDVSFNLTCGQSLGLIGKNGAGKSTLLKLLANVTRPTSGRIDVSGRMSALLELGTGFHPDLTGHENIYLNGSILGLNREEIKNRFDEIVAFSEIKPFIDTPVKRYSSGMLVRLGFAVAACIEPEILLVDEVLAVGDASFRQKCLNRIQSLVDNGTSIIFVSHNLTMVEAICPTSLYLENGQIKRSGETKEIIDYYERDLLKERAHKFEESSARQIGIVTDVQITKIEILAMEGTGATEFNSEQSAEIRVHYISNHSVGSANAVVRIVRTDGLTCCMMRADLDGVELSLHEGGGVLSITVKPLQLVTGTYVIDARILDGSGSLILASKLSKWFYVSGASKGHDQIFGVFEPVRSWAHRSDSRHVTRIEEQEDRSFARW